MKTSFYAIAIIFAVMSAFGASKEQKRNIDVVKNYIIKEVGSETLAAIKKREGGEAFLKKFFADQDWMEAFAGSGRPGGTSHKPGTYADALKALDVLVWNDKNDFIDTPVGRAIATAFALNHGTDWDEKKLVQYMECYREWAADGTLHDSAFDLDTWRWREVVTMGQNADLPVEDLRWIHDFAYASPSRYNWVNETCCYRLFNCFGASVHGWLYYAPWAHRWNTEELRYRVGGVCGAMSKFSSHCAASHGIRSFTTGQPGHCAFLLWNFKIDRWDIGYAVTSHSHPHFSLGGKWFPTNEEQNRYYSSNKRMDAEYLRWQGKYAEAMKFLPGNWNAAYDWQESLNAHPSSDGWKKYAAAVLATFKGAPAQGWQLYMPFLESLNVNRDLKIKAAKAALRTFTETEDKTVEAMYFDDVVIQPLADSFKNDPEAMWELIPVALEGQKGSKTYYNGIVRWASANMMANANDTKRILRILAESSKATGIGLDHKDMIRTASDQEDHASFNHVYTLITKTSPQTLPRLNGKKYPEEDYGGKLISDNALIKLSSSKEDDNPVNYRYALIADDFDDMYGFVAHREKHPWAEVVLAGDSEVTGITLVNAGKGGREKLQVPMDISISTDGKEYVNVKHIEEQQDVWKIQLPQVMRAKYVRATPVRSDKEDGKFFNLHKFLVYGRKLY